MQLGTPDSLDTLVGRNCGSTPQLAELTKAVTTTTETTVETSSEITVGVTVTVGASGGIPGIAEVTAEVATSLTTGFTFTSGQTDTESFTKTVRAPVNIEPRTEILVAIQELKCASRFAHAIACVHCTVLQLASSKRCQLEGTEGSWCRRAESVVFHLQHIWTCVCAPVLRDSVCTRAAQRAGSQWTSRSRRGR